MSVYRTRDTRIFSENGRSIIIYEGDYLVALGMINDLLMIKMFYLLPNGEIVEGLCPTTNADLCRWGFVVDECF